MEGNEGGAGRVSHCSTPLHKLESGDRGLQSKLPSRGKIVLERYPAFNRSGPALVPSPCLVTVSEKPVLERKCSLYMNGGGFVGDVNQLQTLEMDSLRVQRHAFLELPHYCLQKSNLYQEILYKIAVYKYKRIFKFRRKKDEAEDE